MNWRDRRGCRDEDPNLFFAERGRLAGEALSPCHECPVKTECLDIAVRSPWMPYGVWGGLPAKQVRVLWRDRHPDRQHPGVEQAVGLRRDRST